MNDPRYPGYPQQPQMTGYPPQAPAYQQTGYPAQAPQGYPPQQAPAPGAMPAYAIPDEKAVMAGYQAAREAVSRAGGGGRAQFVKFLGPRGETKWGSGVQIGYVSNLPVYILPSPPPKAGEQAQGIYVQSDTHFWKSASHPQGSQVGCAGPGKCLVCAAREAGLAHPDPHVQKRAKDFARVRTQFFYQVALLQYPQAHLGQDGQMRPQILAAGKKLHTAIGDLIANRGLTRIVDPTNGRPVMLKKAKTGPEERDVEYGALDLEPSPLPPAFYGCLQNLHDLRVFIQPPTHEDMVRAVQEMGLPMPGQAIPPAAYNAVPQAPWANPYQQQPQPQFQGFQQPQQAPMNYPAMSPPPPPQYMPPGDPYQFPPPPEMPAGGFQQFQPQPPPPMQPMGGFTPPAGPAQPAPAFFATPPPVVSQPQAQVAYQPQPGNPGQVQVAAPQSGAFQGAAMPPPPEVPQMPPPTMATADVPHQIMVPVPPGSLPSGRDRCFGKFNQADQWCQNCPEWIKGQCLPVSGQAAPTGPDGKLLALQNQLSGGQTH